VNARDEKRVGDHEIFPFVLTAAPLREFVRGVAAFDEDGNAFGTDHVEALMRSGLQPAEIPSIAELRHAAFQCFVRSAGERGQVVERRDAELIDVVHDLRIPVGELKAVAWHGGAFRLVGCLGILPSRPKLVKATLLDLRRCSGVQYAWLPVPFCLRLRQVNRADIQAHCLRRRKSHKTPLPFPALAPARRQKQSDPLSTAVGAGAAS